MSVGMAKLFVSGSAIEEFAVFITPSFVEIHPPTGGGSATSVTVTANVTGGSPPYTYLWTLQAGTPLTINGTISQSTSFTATRNEGGFDTTFYICTVTDSLAAEAFNTVMVAVGGKL